MVSAIDGLGGSMWCQMRIDTANKQMSIVCLKAYQISSQTAAAV